MATVIGQMPQYPLRVPKKESVLAYLHFTVDTSGAIVTANTQSSDPGISVTKSGTGAYALVFPQCPADALLVYCSHQTGTFPTAGQFDRISAKNMGAGTATITTSTTFGGAAADLNQAVEFDVLILANTRSGN